MTDSETARRRAELLRSQAQDARARAHQARADTVAVAEAIAVTGDRVAATMNRLATAQPRQAERLLALCGDAREQAAGVRRRAVRHARAGVPAGHDDAGARLVPRPLTAPAAAGIGPGMLWELLTQTADGVAVTNQDGVIVLASQRLTDTFGYPRDGLTGRSVEMLIPGALRAARREHRFGYAYVPGIRLHDDWAQLAGLRKDGTVVAVQIRLHSAPAAGGRLILAVIRETARPRRRQDPGELAAADPGGRAHADQELELLDRVVASLFHVGFTLQAAPALPPGRVSERIAQALQRLNATILDIQDHITGAHRNRHRPPPIEPGPDL